MAGRNEQIAIDITAKDNASKVIDKLAKKIDGMEADEARITVTAETTKLEKQLDRARQKLEGLAGDEATVQARLIGTIEEDLEQANKLLEKLDGQTATVKIDSGGAVKNIDDLGKSADSSKSVLANMVGNTTQDLGALRGVAGSAGVAIGQMGEYMADAAGSGDKLGTILRNFAGVAAPILAIGVAIQGMMTHLKNVAKVKAFRKDEVEDYADALKEADTVLGAIRAKLEAAEGLSFNIFGKDVDVTAQFTALGLNADKAAQLIAGGVPAIQDWAAAMEAAGANADQLQAVSFVLTTNVEDLAEAQRLAAETSKFFNDETDKGTGAHKASADATDANRAALKRHADELDRAKNATDRLRQANERLRGDLDKREAYLNLLDTFDEVETQGRDAWFAVADGAEGAAEAVRDYEQDQIGAKNAVIDFLAQYDLLPTDPKVMEILTLIDQGELLRAEQQVNELTKNQVIDVSFRVWNPGGIRISSGGGGGIPVAATMSGIPTGAQIAKQIGTVRVPIDTYVRSAPRITGLRD